MSMFDKITPGQIRSLRTGISVSAGKDKAAHLYIVAVLLDRPLTELADISLPEWRRLREEMYPHWPLGDWALGDEFRQRCMELFDAYRENVLGQMRLFEDEK